MNYNNRERAEIYKKAAELVNNGKFDHCCLAIKEIIGEFVNDEDFPELYLFKQKSRNNVWWKECDVDNRVLALLFASEMAIG